MSTDEVVIHRDVNHDTLSVIKKGADPDRTTNVSANADLVLRFDEKKKVVGLIIDDFSRFLPELKDAPEYVLMEEFYRVIEFLNDKIARRVVAYAGSAL